MKIRLMKSIVIVFLVMISVLLLIPFFIIITKVRLDDFYQLLIEKLWFYPKFWNSMLYSLSIAAGSTAISLLAAFAICKGNLRFEKIILSALLLIMLMPLQTTLLPNYIGIRDLKLLDTRAAMVLPMIFSPFAIYLMIQYMKENEEECLEAARLETSSVFCMIHHVVIPQMKGCLTAVFIFMYLEGFSMVEQSLFYIKKERLKPLSVILSSLQDEEKYLIYAIGIVCILGFFIMNFLYEEELEAGLGKLKL